MSYEIKNIKQENNNIITTTEFTLSNGTKKTITQTHFQPDSADDVIRGIENQEVSEERMMGLPARISAIKDELDTLIQN